LAWSDGRRHRCGRSRTLAVRVVVATPGQTAVRRTTPGSDTGRVLEQGHTPLVLASRNHRTECPGPPMSSRIRSAAGGSRLATRSERRHDVRSVEVQVYDC